MELSKKNREAISQLARSGDAQKLMALLNKQSGNVQEAAKAAAGGDPAGGSAYSLRHGPRGRDTSLKEGGA